MSVIFEALRELQSHDAPQEMLHKGSKRSISVEQLIKVSQPTRVETDRDGVSPTLIAEQSTMRALLVIGLLALVGGALFLVARDDRVSLPANPVAQPGQPPQPFIDKGPVTLSFQPVFTSLSNQQTRPDTLDHHSDQQAEESSVVDAPTPNRSLPVTVVESVEHPSSVRVVPDYPLPPRISPLQRVKVVETGDPERSESGPVFAESEPSKRGVDVENVKRDQHKVSSELTAPESRVPPSNAPKNETVLNTVPEVPQIAGSSEQTADQRQPPIETITVTNGILDPDTRGVGVVTERLFAAIDSNNVEMVSKQLSELEQLLGSSSPFVAKMRAYWHLTREEYSSAFGLLSTVLKQLPDDLEANVNMVVAEMGMKRHRDAVRRLERLMRDYPDHPRILSLIDMVQASSSATGR
ncbi:MAG: tetratricopeptide repeat protein [Magnetococcales bacterium]|nr:tetratricopeptide repeat protein [Magnetococcales bacterium]